MRPTLYGAVFQVLVEKSPDGSCRPQELHGKGTEDRKRANSAARAGGQVNLVEPLGLRLIVVLIHRLARLSVQRCALFVRAGQDLSAFWLSCTGVSTIQNLACYLCDMYVAC